jgi:hypothetical protein
VHRQRTDGRFRGIGRAFRAARDHRGTVALIRFMPLNPQQHFVKLALIFEYIREPFRRDVEQISIRWQHLARTVQFMFDLANEHRCKVCHCYPPSFTHQNRQLANAPAFANPPNHFGISERWHQRYWLLAPNSRPCYNVRVMIRIAIAAIAIVLALAGATFSFRAQGASCLTLAQAKIETAQWQAVKVI